MASPETHAPDPVPASASTTIPSSPPLLRTPITTPNLAAAAEPAPAVYQGYSLQASYGGYPTTQQPAQPTQPAYRYPPPPPSYLPYVPSEHNPFQTGAFEPNLLYQQHSSYQPNLYHHQNMYQPSPFPPIAHQHNPYNLSHQVDQLSQLNEANRLNRSIQSTHQHLQHAGASTPSQTRQPATTIGPLRIDPTAAAVPTGFSDNPFFDNYLSPTHRGSTRPGPAAPNPFLHQTFRDPVAARTAAPAASLQPPAPIRGPNLGTAFPGQLFCQSSSSSDSGRNNVVGLMWNPTQHRLAQTETQLHTQAAPVQQSHGQAGPASDADALGYNNDHAHASAAAAFPQHQHQQNHPTPAPPLPLSHDRRADSDIGPDPYPNSSEISPGTIPPPRPHRFRPAEQARAAAAAAATAADRQLDPFANELRQLQASWGAHPDRQRPAQVHYGLDSKPLDNDHNRRVRRQLRDQIGDRPRDAAAAERNNAEAVSSPEFSSESPDFSTLSSPSASNGGPRTPEAAPERAATATTVAATAPPAPAGQRPHPPSLQFAYQQLFAAGAGPATASSDAPAFASALFSHTPYAEPGLPARWAGRQGRQPAAAGKGKQQLSTGPVPPAQLASSSADAAAASASAAAHRTEPRVLDSSLVADLSPDQNEVIDSFDHAKLSRQPHPAAAAAAATELRLGSDRDSHSELYASPEPARAAAAAAAGDPPSPSPSSSSSSSSDRSTPSSAGPPSFLSASASTASSDLDPSLLPDPARPDFARFERWYTSRQRAEARALRQASAGTRPKPGLFSLFPASAFEPYYPDSHPQQHHLHADAGTDPADALAALALPLDLDAALPGIDLDAAFELPSDVLLLEPAPAVLTTAVLERQLARRAQLLAAAPAAGTVTVRDALERRLGWPVAALGALRAVAGDGSGDGPDGDRSAATIESAATHDQESRRKGGQAGREDPVLALVALFEGIVRSDRRLLRTTVQHTLQHGQQLD